MWTQRCFCSLQAASGFKILSQQLVFAALNIPKGTWCLTWNALGVALLGILCRPVTGVSSLHLFLSDKAGNSQTFAVTWIFIPHGSHVAILILVSFDSTLCQKACRIRTVALPTAVLSPTLRREKKVSLTHSRREENKNYTTQFLWAIGSQRSTSNHVHSPFSYLLSPRNKCLGFGYD